jgi:ATP-dependent Clp protease adapter protein ClpS
MSNINPENKPDLVAEELDIVNNTFASKVILFNDNIHTFDDVISQLIKAIGCTSERAESYAWEVHTKGKACVFIGEIEKCLKVSGILEEIGLHTQIES